MKSIRLLFLLMAAVLLVQSMGICAFAEGETYGFAVDSVNGIRWEEYICVYKDIPSTGQNIYGCNIIVINGVVTEKLSAGDERGEDLAVPENGFVVSGIGNNGTAMFNAVNVGDNAVFDEYGKRVLFSSGEIDPFTEYEIEITGYNDARYDNTVIIYNKAGETTGTNPYGCEAVVDKDGYVIAMGGNNSVIPQGGFVVSVIDNPDISDMLINFTIGAKCQITGNKVKVTYSAEELKRTAEFELDLIKQDFEAAKNQFRLVDHHAIRSAIDAVDIEEISTLEQRNDVIDQIKAIKPLLVEQKTVDTRSVWHDPTERTAEEIKATVEAAKAAKINEFIVYVNSSDGTLIPIPDHMPLDKDPIVKEFDLLQTYIDQCRANDMSIVVVVPVMSSNIAWTKKQWHDVTNTGEKGELFYSPANTEYRQAFMNYIRFILDNYDVDGLQLDYIRYSEYQEGFSVESGYDDATIALFEEKTGHGRDVVEAIGIKRENHRYWSVWRNFKVELINSWVEECYNIAKEIRPDIYVTAAVAESMGKEVYCQDYAAWLKGGYIDGIYPMTYNQGVNEYTINAFGRSITDKSFMVMGSGSFLSRDNEYIIDEVRNTAIYGGDGVAHFEWTAVRDLKYTELFANEIYTSDAIPLTADKTEVVTKLLETAEKRIKLYEGENADQVKALITKSTEKADIEKAVSDIKALVSESDGEYLLRDMDLALRVLNMNKDTSREFVKGAYGKYDIKYEVSDSQDTSEEVPEVQSQPTTQSDSSVEDDSEGNDITTYIIIGLAVLAAVLAGILVKVKKK